MNVGKPKVSKVQDVATHNPYSLKLSSDYNTIVFILQEKAGSLK